MSYNHSNSDRTRPERRKSADRRARTDRRKSDRRGNFRRRGIATLIVLSSLSTLALIIFFVFQTNIAGMIDWNKMLHVRTRNVENFRVGDVKLGMSPEAVSQIHPNLNLNSVVQGEKVATFNADGAKYAVWFISINGADKAFRIRYDQIFPGKTDTDVLEDFGRRHGKPSTSDCNKVTLDEKNCHFQWWLSGGISLNVLSSTKKQTDQPVTRVTMIATDTYLDGKRIRNLEQ